LPFKQSASSSNGARNSQQKKWNKNCESGLAAYKNVKTESASPIDPNKTGGRPKTGNWRSKNVNSTTTDRSFTRFLSDYKMLLIFFLNN
jgi:hypothetical protein